VGKVRLGIPECNGSNIRIHSSHTHEQRRDGEPTRSCIFSEKMHRRRCWANSMFSALLLLLLLPPTARGRTLSAHGCLSAPHITRRRNNICQQPVSMVQRDRRQNFQTHNRRDIHNRQGLGRSRGRTVSTSSSSEPVASATRYHVYLEKGGRQNEYVARVLIMVCSLSESDASSITNQASRFGLAMVGTFEKALAEHTYNGMRRAGLTASLKPADDEFVFGSGHAGEDLWP
jgi:ATP-dependent Clp protease adapter protein ClpS